MFGSEYERKTDLSQYYTDPVTAKRIIEWAFNGRMPNSVLEPTVGRGALIKPIIEKHPSIPITAFDLDPVNVDHVSSLGDVDVKLGDFLTVELGRYEFGVMNPPYENDMDAKCVIRAARHCDRIFPLVRGVFRHGIKRWNIALRWLDIHREVVFRGRPEFGGEHKPMQDFCIYEMTIRSKPRRPGEPSKPYTTEWW